MSDKLAWDDSEAFGARLREERERLGLKDHELTHLAGLSVTYQKKFEAGAVSIPIDYLHALALRSDIDVLYVLTGERSPLSHQLTSDELKLLEHHRAMSTESRFTLERVAAALVDQLADELR